MSPSAEQHFSPTEVAAKWGFDEKSIKRIFEHEPGVLVYTRPTSKTKRRYRTLRIPESIIARVHQRLVNG